MWVSAVPVSRSASVADLTQKSPDQCTVLSHSQENTQFSVSLLGKVAPAPAPAPAASASSVAGEVELGGVSAPKTVMTGAAEVLAEPTSTPIPHSSENQDPFGEVSEVKGTKNFFNIICHENIFIIIHTGHSEYIQKLIHAKAMADMNGKSVTIHWRGYYTSIKPNLPPFTMNKLRTLLSEALAKIKLPTDEEREVFFS